MEGNRRLATWAGAILGAALALVLNSVLAHAWDEDGPLREEFHHTYSLSPDGRIALANVNGAVHITAWDQDQVQVDAIKRAETQEQLNETQIRIGNDHDSNSISIETRYADGEGSWRRHGRYATVEYTLHVPRRARLDEIKLVNGGLDVLGVAGEVRASCVNGRLEARQLGGEAKLATVNGPLEAQFSRADRIDISSVNGGIDLTVPSDTNARLEASTMHGEIHNDFGFESSGHSWMGRELHGELGAGGGTDIRLSDVNGAIRIHRGTDGSSD
jgi:hypothetical protein